MTLEYDAVGHRYSVNGVEIPSVTRVIADVLAGDRRWSDEAAMWRGSVVHKVCELDDLGTLDEATIDPSARGYLDAWRRFVREMSPDIQEVEEARVSRGYSFAGRPDRVVRLNGHRTVLDIKTGAVAAVTAIQLAAYCELTSSVQRCAVRLDAGGSYTLTVYPVGDKHRDFSVFSSALSIWNWRKERRLL